MRSVIGEVDSLTEEQKRNYITERTQRYLARHGKSIDDLPMPTQVAWGIFASFHPQEFFDALEGGELDDDISLPREVPGMGADSSQLPADSRTAKGVSDGAT